MHTIAVLKCTVLLVSTTALMEFNGKGTVAAQMAPFLPEHFKDLFFHVGFKGEASISFETLETAPRKMRNALVYLSLVFV